MLHYFKKNDSTNNTADEIFTVYESDVTIIMIICNWFKKFKAGNFDLKESGYPITIRTDTNLINAIFAENLQ